HAAGAAGPALLVQGDADNQDYVASATALSDALQSAGKDVTLTLVPGAQSAFDQGTSGALTPAGKQSAQQVLEWLAARFPPGSRRGRLLEARSERETAAAAVRLRR